MPALEQDGVPCRGCVKQTSNSNNDGALGPARRRLIVQVSWVGDDNLGSTEYGVPSRAREE